MVCINKYELFVPARVATAATVKGRKGGIPSSSASLSAVEEKQPNFR